MSGVTLVRCLRRQRRGVRHNVRYRGVVTCWWQCSFQWANLRVALSNRFARKYEPIGSWDFSKS